MYCALQTHIRDDTVPHNFQCKWIFHVMQRTDETGDTRKGFVKFSSHIITIKSSKKIYHIFHFLSELLLQRSFSYAQQIIKLNALKSALTLTYYVLILTLLLWSLPAVMVTLWAAGKSFLTKSIFHVSETYLLDSIYLIAFLFGEEYIFWVHRCVWIHEIRA